MPRPNGARCRARTAPEQVPKWRPTLRRQSAPNCVRNGACNGTPTVPESAPDGVRISSRTVLKTALDMTTPEMVRRPTPKRRPNRPRITTCKGVRQASVTAHDDMHRYSKVRCYSKAGRYSETRCYKATDARIEDDIRNRDNGHAQNDGDRH